MLAIESVIVTGFLENVLGSNEEQIKDIKIKVLIFFLIFTTIYR